jgi:hypothetical protein
MLEHAHVLLLQQTRVVPANCHVGRRWGQRVGVIGCICDASEGPWPAGEEREGSTQAGGHDVCAALLL